LVEKEAGRLKLAEIRCRRRRNGFAERLEIYPILDASEREVRRERPFAKQINASYEHNLFDGGAVLMRRLVEVLLILSYRYLRTEAAIQDNNGNFEMLEKIVNDAKANSTLALSQNGRNSLDTSRGLGNFSAHKIEYTCRREYIAPHIQEYRALVVELLHKWGIRNLIGVGKERIAAAVGCLGRLSTPAPPRCRWSYYQPRVPAAAARRRPQAHIGCTRVLWSSELRQRNQDFGAITKCKAGVGRVMAIVASQGCDASHAT
jgi:hypothetical protein